MEKIREKATLEKFVKICGLTIYYGLMGHPVHLKYQDFLTYESRIYKVFFCAESILIIWNSEFVKPLQFSPSFSGLTQQKCNEDRYFHYSISSSDRKGPL